MRPTLALAFALAACGDDPPAGVAAPTYYADVATIFADRCVSCHQAGGVAPVALDDAETAAAWSASIRDATQDRRMPPFLATDDGSCGTFVGEGWLSDDELATIAAWVDAGAPAGDPAEAPELDVPLPALDRVDLALVTPPTTPDVSSGDEYRCFLFENDADVEVFLTGYEGVPGAPELVHHMTAYAVDRAAPSWVEGLSNGDLIAAHDAGDDGEGWACFGAAGEGVRHDGIPAVWAPGQGVVDYPDGLGYALPPEQDLVLQMHYSSHDGDVTGTDSSTMRFRVEDEVERVAWFAAPDDFLLSYILEGYGMGVSEQIPPGEEAYRYSFVYGGAAALADGGFDPATAGSFELVGVMPHMHELGVRQWVEVVGDEADACALEVLAWDAGWQQFYFYDAPIAMDAATDLAITCEWDTTGLAAPTYPGWGNDQEMCLATLMFALPPGVSR